MFNTYKISVMKRYRHILISSDDGERFGLHRLRLAAYLLIEEAYQLLLLQD